MANDVRNRVTFKGDRKRIDEMLEHIHGEDGTIGQIDFNTIIPMPKELEMTAGTIIEKAITCVCLRENLYVFRYNKSSIEDYLKISGFTENELYELGIRYMSNIVNFGHATWYTWRVHNWGTKWNAYDDKGSEYELLFSTAWDAPFPIMEKLSKMYPDIEFTLKYADEDYGENCGTHIYKNGICIHNSTPETYVASVDFAEHLWKHNPRTKQST